MLTQARPITAAKWTMYREPESVRPVAHGHRPARAAGRFSDTSMTASPVSGDPSVVFPQMKNRMYVSTFFGNDVRQYDISNPLEPELVEAIEVPHPNMMKLSPDSERLYVSNSLMSSMDPDENFHVWLLDVGPDGMSLDPEFEPDFTGFAAGPAGPHDMLLKRGSPLLDYVPGAAWRGGMLPG